MNGMLLKHQLKACGMLGVLMLLELGLGVLSRGQLQNTLNQTIEADYQADPLPSLITPKQSADGFNTIVERPLFVEGRKPMPDTAQQNPEAAADVGQLEDWVLIGIYNKDKKQVALFRKQNEAKKYLKLNEQQTISGWQLTQIHADSVILQLDGQQKTVMLLKPREQVKTPQPAKRPATPPVKETPPPGIPNNNPPEE